MTPQTPMLICATVPWAALPDPERDVIRRFLTEHVKGVDRESDAAWRRLWGQVTRAEPGEGFQLYRLEERSGPFHKRHRAILERLFHAQERFPSIKAMHDFLKLRCWFVDWIDGKPVPKSTRFDKCTENEIREFHRLMVEQLHEPVVQRRLFPSVRSKDRQGMVDSVLADREDQ